MASNGIFDPSHRSPGCHEEEGYMNNRRLLYLTLIGVTLGVGVIIGTIVSGGVKATAEQKAATLVIPDPVSLSNAFSQIAAQLEPAVVKINTEATVQQPARGRGGPNQDPFDFFDFFGGNPGQQDRDFKARSLGTGFIVDKAGYILTNQHVVDKADKIKVVLDDKSEYAAKLIGSDKETDLAVIKIDVGHDLPTAKLGNSDAVRVGDWVLAIGTPFDFDHTVTAGIISARGREGTSSGTGGQFQSFLQTDAAINPGNSGGPLVSMSGEVIGVNTAIVSETRQFAGLGFALPSNTAIKVYNQLVNTGKVTRGSIGIQYDSSQDAAKLRAFGVKSGSGVIVEDVIAGGPAAKAGLRSGDVVTEIDGAKIGSPTALLDVVANSVVGKTVQVKVIRDGKEMTIPVVIGDRKDVIREDASNAAPDDQRGETTPSKLGLTVAPVTSDMVRQFGLANTEGVMITNVQEDSAAQEAGFARGMIITQIRMNGQVTDIGGLSDYNKAQQAMKSGLDAAFRVLVRNPNTNQYVARFVTITIP